MRFLNKIDAIRLAFQRIGALVERHEVQSATRDLTDEEWEAMALLCITGCAPRPRKRGTRKSRRHIRPPVRRLRGRALRREEAPNELLDLG